MKWIILICVYEDLFMIFINDEWLKYKCFIYLLLNIYIFKYIYVFYKVGKISK